MLWLGFILRTGTNALFSVEKHIISPRAKRTCQPPRQVPTVRQRGQSHAVCPLYQSA